MITMNYFERARKFRAKKRLGQNFLTDESAIETILDVSDITKDDIVVEIGPGLGALTAKLAESAKEVIAIELDDNMINVLTERFSLYENVQIIHGDVLKVNLKELIENKASVKVVANLPYYITTPIVMKLLEEKLNIEQITVMVQKEVGERFTATPNGKEYGAITVSIQYYTEPKIVIDVPRCNFNPVPDVDSCVVNLKVRKEHIKMKDEKAFFKVIKAAFSQRRKNIGNSLMGIGKSKQEIKDMLEALEIDSNLRAENLSLETFVKIADYIA